MHLWKVLWLGSFAPVICVYFTDIFRPPTRVPENSCEILISLRSYAISWLDGSPQSYLLIYHSFPSHCNSPPLAHIRQMTFWNHTTKIKTDEDMRFSQPISIVLTPLYDINQIPPVFTTCERKAMAINTIFILIKATPWRPVRQISKFEQNLPALKYTLQYVFGQRTMINLRVDFGRYCNPKTSIRFEQIAMLHSPFEIHQQIFTKTPGSFVEGVVWLSFAMNVKKHQTVLNKCPQYLRYRLEKLSICSHHVFVINTLIDVHNITTNIILGNYNARYDELDFSSAGQYILGGYDAATSFSWPIRLTSGIIPDYSDSTSLIYCLSRKKLSKFPLSFWFKPFQLDLWLAAGFLYIMYLSYNTVKKRIANTAPSVQILNFSPETLGELIALTLAIFYGNSLLGLLVTGSPQPAFILLKDVLLAGFKILHFDLFGGTDAWYFAFKIPDLEAYFKHAFRVLNTHPYSVFDMRYRVEFILQKCVLPYDTSVAALELTQIQIAVNKLEINSQLDCNIVPEKVDEGSLFWHIYTVNRYWLAKTIKKTQEAGLQLYWTQRRKQAYLNTYNMTSWRRILYSEFVEWESFIPALAFLGICMMAASLLLILEIVAKIQ